MKLNGILFVHIPRTAGTHFEKLLGFKGHNHPPRCGSIAYGANRKEIMGWDKNLKMMITHATYEEMVEHNLVSLNEKLISVSIIRSPYDRAVSLFKYFGGDSKWGSFRAFLDLLKNGMSKDYFYKPQHLFLTYKGETVIDNLIKFENFKEDMEKFKAKYDLSFEVAFDAEKQIRRSKINFKEFYDEKKHLDTVEEIYQKDFELFGYGRDGRI